MKNFKIAGSTGFNRSNTTTVSEFVSSFMMSTVMSMIMSMMAMPYLLYDCLE